MATPETGLLTELYRRLSVHYGPQHWWPADSRFEMIVGAFLTQNTNWGNVEKALANLRAAGKLNIAGLASMPPAVLEKLIRPAGFFRQKSARLQAFCHWLMREHAGSLDSLFGLDDATLRHELLQHKGVGPETADSILLYAAGRASFVVDAYTHRILARLGMEPPGCSYEQTRTLFMENLQHDSALFNEYHALLVRHAKEHCRKRAPLCSSCPLRDLCTLDNSAAGD